ncbi:MAG: hypothetical protein E7471_01160 [Ruminococcaceae bacterium]|nr:hypothetical protein [Oscillospiraceae bacterium]
MKRWFPFVLLPLFLGLCGALLRATELAYSFDRHTGLFVNQLAVTPVLMTVSLVALAVFVFLSFRLPAAEDSAPSPFVLIGGVVSAISLLATVGVVILSIMNSTFALTALIQALLSVYAATAVLVMVKYGFKKSDGGAYAVLVSAPVFWLAYTLILIFRDRIADPILLDYAYLLFACTSALIFLYTVVGVLFGKGKPRGCALFGSLALFFSTTELFGHVFATLLPMSLSGFSLSLTEALTLIFVVAFTLTALPELLKNKE